MLFNDDKIINEDFILGNYKKFFKVNFEIMQYFKN